MKITTVGIDLAKSVFQVHGVSERGKAVLRKQLKRSEMLKFFANLPPCLIGMEACGSAHYWARKLIELGHEVRLMAPQFVKPYVKTNKNDRNDAEAICEAVARPNMRFVPVKSSEQQAVLALHRARSGVMKARNAQANQIRGLLGEFGIVLPQGIGQLRRWVTRDSGRWRQRPAGADACAAAQAPGAIAASGPAGRRARARDRAWHRQNDDSRRVERIGGIGPITASAFVASVGNTKNFKNGRQVAAWLGIVPRQDSTGGKPKLLGISKHGDVYLRTLLIHGARAVLRHLERRPDQTDSWLARLMPRRGKNVAAVALANKNARIAWALLAHQRDFAPDYVSTGTWP